MISTSPSSFVSHSASRWDAYASRIEGLIGRPLTERQLHDANEAFLEGESAVEFALSISSTSLDQEPPQPPAA